MFLMLTVQYSLYLTLETTLYKKKKRKEKETFVICYLNQNMVIICDELSFYHNGSSLLLCNISKHIFFAVFCRFKTSKILFFFCTIYIYIYIFCIIIQDSARLRLVDWNNISPGCVKCMVGMPITNDTDTHLHIASHSLGFSMPVIFQIKWLHPSYLNNYKIFSHLLI